MNVSSFIAGRYLFSKKSSNAVNVISWVSVFSIAVATFALVTVLSAFNGLQDLVESLYEEFEPDVKISPLKGKYFSPETKLLDNINQVEGVETVMPILEELSLVRYDKQQSPCTIKGVPKEFISISGVDQKIYNGTAQLEMNGQPTALVGYGLASVLNVYVKNPLQNLKLYAPKLSGNTILSPDAAFHIRSISPVGVFMINPDIDNKFVLVPLDFARELLGKKGLVTSLEIKVAAGKEEDVKEAIQAFLGDELKVQTRFELNELIYQTNQSEKVVTFFILLFILVIAAFNVISSLTMILLEKDKDIRTLRTLGFNLPSIRSIFLREGIYINLIGIGIGMGAGLILCLLQIYVGLVSLDGGIVDYYPVKLLWSDFALILCCAFLIGLAASYFPSRLLVKPGNYDNISAEA